MIPAIFAAPMVEGVVGGVVGSVMNCFSPSAPPPSAPSDTTSFAPYLNRAATATTAPSSAPLSPTGTLRSNDWNQMGSTDVQSWAKSLSGRHVDATDDSGRIISGTVTGMQMMGGMPALNIGGHLVSLSQLKQISWSPSVA